MKGISDKINIPVIYDECEEGLCDYQIFKRHFGEQIFETSVTRQRLQGTADTTLAKIFEQKYNRYLFITGNKKDKYDFLSSDFTSTYNPNILLVCFSNNTSNKAKKESLLRRLLRTQGFKYKNIYNWFKKYVIILISDNEVKYLLRKSWNWEVRPLYNGF